MVKKKIEQLQPVAFKNVVINKGFWGPKLKVNREETLPYEYKVCKQTGRIDAFKLKWQEGMPNRPHKFWDSDVAKWLEAACYSLITHPNRELRKMVDEVAGLIIKAQQPDGYINSYFTVMEPENRWKNLRTEHELYCAGHLIEAAVAHYEATDDDKLLKTLCKYTDYVDSLFGFESGKRRGCPGHEEIELALVKLYQVTDKEKYLKLAKYFIDERGVEPDFFIKESQQLGKAINKGNLINFQAHKPVREQEKAKGHAVRLGYLYAGMADVGAKTEDGTLLKACRKIWRNIVNKRMYVTGGVGSSHFGECFTEDYDLPNETAYAETCAQIALVFFAHRMLQIDKNSEYADIMELALYNSILSGISPDGKLFYYANPLAAYPEGFKSDSRKRVACNKRQEWWDCACCPPNIARLFASLGQYIFSTGKNGVWIHLFVNSKTQFHLEENKIGLEVNTDYPWKERVVVKVKPDKPAEFSINLRIPQWCRKPTVKVNDKKITLKPILKHGYAVITRKWSKGDVIELVLPMPVEKIEAHPAVRHNCGKIALKRGPIVYCLEEVDNGKNLNDLFLINKSELKVKTEKKLFGGIPVIQGWARRRETGNWKNILYRSAGESNYREMKIKAIPYFLWANRKPGEMIVWINS